jgi:hypothetical protein
MECWSSGTTASTAVKNQAATISIITGLSSIDLKVILIILYFLYCLSTVEMPPSHIGWPKGRALFVFSPSTFPLDARSFVYRIGGTTGEAYLMPFLVNSLSLSIAAPHWSPGSYVW